MLLSAAVLAGAVLDVLFADPEKIPHPVVLMGKCISRMEQALRRSFPKDADGELRAGRILAAVLPLGTFACSLAVCRLCLRIHPVLYFLIETLWCWQCLAARGLRDEAEAVRKRLEERDLDGARKQVSRIVGRDTQSLDEEGVTKACVETVAENLADGVTAPLMYMLIGGAPLALAYKSVNTMDSMVGYRNERYLYFGRAAAKLDDAAGFVPARLSALLWIAASFLYPGADGRNAYRIWRRDRRKHASPNSAQTESACAGSLHVQLGGPASYFGKPVDKPVIGDRDRQIDPDDIRTSCRLMLCASALALCAGLLLRVWILHAAGAFL